METRTRIAHDKRWPFWLATLLLVLAALVAHLVPIEDTPAAAFTSLSSMQVDASDPVASDGDPDLIVATPPASRVRSALRAVLVITGDTQHHEAPPQRPPRTLA